MVAPAFAKATTTIANEKTPPHLTPQQHQRSCRINHRSLSNLHRKLLQPPREPPRRCSESSVCLQQEDWHSSAPQHLKNISTTDHHLHTQEFFVDDELLYYKQQAPRLLLLFIFPYDLDYYSTPRLPQTTRPHLLSSVAALKNGDRPFPRLLHVSPPFCMTVTHITPERETTTTRPAALFPAVPQSGTPHRRAASRDSSPLPNPDSGKGSIRALPRVPRESPGASATAIHVNQLFIV